MFNVPPAYVCKTCLLFAAAAFLLAARGSFDPFFKNRGIIKLSSYLKSERRSGKRGGETTEERRQLRGSKSVNHCPSSCCDLHEPSNTSRSSFGAELALLLEVDKIDPSNARLISSLQKRLSEALANPWGCIKFFWFCFFMCELESIAGAW